MTQQADYDVVVSHLSYQFEESDGHLKTLCDISFEVPRGEMFCVVGPSGCGKTTLLRILLGDYVPTSGTAYVHQDRRREGLAYIPQEPLLLPWRTLIQNAALGLELKEKITDKGLTYIRHLISVYGLRGFEGKRPGKLSGGMQQRTAVIRALAGQPRILLCDEPFSAVDFVTRLELNSRFKKMCRVAGITTVFVTHNIEEAIFLGDTIAVLSRRPARIVNTYRPELSVHPEDAVLCRTSPEFGELFRSIWQDLEHRA